MADTIKIGGMVFSLEEITGLHEDGTKLSGRIRYDGCVISIETGDCAQAKWQTTWHEVIHALFHQSGRREVGHDVVDMLAFGVLQVLRDNPWLARVPGEGEVNG